MARKDRTKHKKAKYVDALEFSDDETEPQLPTFTNEEEAALEESVFGKGKQSIWEDPSDNIQDTGLADAKDDDLFVVDTGDQEESEHEEESEPEAGIDLRKQGAWHDPADEGAQVSLGGVKRRRKLRHGAEEDVVSAGEYEERLRSQFERIHGTPAWVAQRRQAVQKRRGAESDDEDIDEILASGKAVRDTATGRRDDAHFLPIDRLRDIGKKSHNRIVSVGFHPHASLMFTANNARTLSMYHVDGIDNEEIHSVVVPELPMQNAQFHPSGKSVLMAGHRPFLMSLDVETGQVTRSSRGLFHAGLGGFDKTITGGQGALDTFAFNADGSRLAIAGRNGYVHIADYKSSGTTVSGSQIVSQVKLNSNASSVDWLGENTLVTLADSTSEVYTWDVRNTASCVSRWFDDGAFGSRVLKAGPDAASLAVGSQSGVVNLYRDASISNVPVLRATTRERPADASLDALDTPVYSLAFNQDASILAAVSREKKDQLRLINCRTGRPFTNWPTSSTPLHKVSCAAFASDRGYLAVGNERGKVLLYIVK